MDSDISQQHIYTVSELNDEVSGLLSSNFGIVWIEGEISNYMKSAAGHAYFLSKTLTQVFDAQCLEYRINRLVLGWKTDNTFWLKPK